MGERITASVFYGLHRPSPCDLRAYLRARKEPEGKPSPYEEVILELGKFYEQKHLSSLGDFEDLRGGAEDERIARTIECVKKGVAVIYQPLFRSVTKVDGRDLEIVGEPDLLVREDDGYIIRDVKLSRRITEKDHPEIVLQLGLYGWLYEKTIGSKSRRLEVFAGTGVLETVEYSMVEKAYGELERAARMLREEEAPFSPVGWTKCGTCGFRERCWPPAVDSKDVATIPGVDQGLVRALRNITVLTAGDLLNTFDVEKLASFQRPWGQRLQKVGKAAEKIFRFAKAISSGAEELIQVPSVPMSENYVMFDLEGLPPQLDELDKIFLWGMQVFGAKPSEYFGEIANSGSDGDREGWEAFLERARLIFDMYGDLPFVHWHHYERTKLDAYIERYGDGKGIAERVRRNLLDLLPVTQASVALPLPSYSLKVVEKYVGFERTQNEYGGDWAMATFIRATETSDEETRAKLLDDIRTYNREDLEATWAVLQWLKTK